MTFGYHSIAASGGGGGSLTVVDNTADSNISASVNTIHVVDMNDGSTPFTAHRIFALPGTAAVGDRVGVYIKDGDSTYDLQVRTAASSNDTIDGVDVSTSADHTRLFITGEYMEFQCIVADTAWATIVDKRIPCYVHMHRNGTNQSSIADDAWDQIEFTTTASASRGNIDDLANDQIVLRRNGIYLFRLAARSSEGQDDGSRAAVKITDDAETNQLSRTSDIVGSTSAADPTTTLMGFFSDGNIFEAHIRIAHAAPPADLEGAIRNTFFKCWELI